jgi:hypothetical protein
MSERTENFNQVKEARLRAAIFNNKSSTKTIFKEKLVYFKN